MLRLFATLAAFACIASAAQADSVKQIFEKYGLLGSFGAGCAASRPARKIGSSTNRSIDPHHVQRDLMTGPGTRQWVAVFDKASELKPNEILVRRPDHTDASRDKTVENEPVDGVWRIEQDRMQQWRPRFQGKPLIVNGRLHGRELPWSKKCAVPAVTHEARNRGPEDLDQNIDRSSIPHRRQKCPAGYHLRRAALPEIR
jgi:hypothetical protein